MNTFKPVEYVKGWCYHVLPLVYDDSLSYEEQICKLTNAVNQCITNINNLPEIVEEAVREFVETQGLENIVRDVFAELVFINVKNPPEDMTPAKGDSLTDDTEALQTLINYAGKNNGILFFPAGNYMVKSLTLPNNATLMGYDRYKTTLVLIGGTNASMFTGNISNCTIANIGFNGNRTVQTLHEPLFNCTVNNALISNVLLSNANTLGNFTKADNSHSQFSDIVCNNFNDAIFINGNSPCSITNILFTMDTGSANTLININTNNSIYGIFSNITTNYGIVCTGVGNTGTGTILNASTALQNTLPSNNFNIMGTTQSFNITNNLYNQISGTREEITKNNKINNVGGNETSSITGDYQLTANNIFLNPANPLKYGTVQKLNENFNYVEAQDKNNNPYKILVEGENIEPIQSKSSMSGELVTSRVGRFLLKNNNYTSDEGNTLNFAYAQGSVIIESTNRIIIAYIPYNTANFQLSNDLMLREYSLSNGNLIREAIISNGGHGNGIGYNPNNNTLYIAQCFMYTSKGVSNKSNVIVTVDYNTFTKTGEFTVNNPSGSGWGYATYDIETEKLYVGGTRAVYEVNPTNGSIIASYNIDFPIERGSFTGQSAYMRNNILYQVISNPEMLIVNDINNGFINTYNMPYFGQRIYPWGENESLSVLSDGTIYITTCMDGGPNPDNEIVQIFKTNLSYSVPQEQPYYGTPLFYSDIYINNNVNSFNPDGSEDNPFNSTEEMLQVLRSNLYYKDIVNIRFTQGTYGQLRIYKMNNLDIQCANSTFSIVQVSRSSNIYIRQALLDKSLTTYANSCCSVYHSIVSLIDCYVKENSVINSLTDGLFYFETSTITWQGGISPKSGYIDASDYDGNVFITLKETIFNNSYRLRNIKLLNSINMYGGVYPLFVGTVNPTGSGKYNSFVGKTIELSSLTNNFFFITFGIETTSGRETAYKFFIDDFSSASTTYFIRDFNMADSISSSSGGLQMYELSMQMTPTGFNYNWIHNINLTISGSTVNAQIPDPQPTNTWALKYIYLSNF